MGKKAKSERSGGLMVTALDSRSSGPGSSSGYCVLGQDTLLSLCLFPCRCMNGYRQI